MTGNTANGGSPAGLQPDTPFPGAATPPSRKASAAPNPPVVLAILKAPRPGYVKTRLAREVGVDQATRIYRAMAERQLRSVPGNFRLEVHYAPRGAAAEMRAWLGVRPLYCLQSAGDLGQRLARAFVRGFDRGGKAVIAIGADCPGLDGDCLQEAVRRLERSDVVIGPAADGGYYLIGLRQPEPRLFEGIAWSSGQVLQQTLERVAACGLSCELLSVKEDVDDLASLRRLGSMKGEGGDLALLARLASALP